MYSNIQNTHRLLKNLSLTRNPSTTMNSLTRAMEGMALTAKRFVHHRMLPKAYPKVNVKDVELHPLRHGFRRKRKPLLSQTVKNTLFPSTVIKELYKKRGKPVPRKHRGNSDQIARRNYERFQEEVAMGLPHFKVGGKKVYFPKARVILLRPLAKHTPYQARFLVPRNFNKLDLRDYLWHVYGLRALNVTVQLAPASWRRGMNDYARHRSPQFKKMTIDMEEPFVWPDMTEDQKDPENLQERQQMSYKIRFEGESNKDMPVDAFEGLYNKPQLPNAFVSAKSQKALKAKVDHITTAEEHKSDRAAVAKLLNL